MKLHSTSATAYLSVRFLLRFFETRTLVPFAVSKLHGRSWIGLEAAREHRVDEAVLDRFRA
jgi:hypothetical protein